MMLGMLSLLPRLPPTMSSTRHSHLCFSTMSPALRSLALHPSTQTQASLNAEPSSTSDVVAAPRSSWRSAQTSSACSARRSTSWTTLRILGTC